MDTKNRTVLVPERSKEHSDFAFGFMVERSSRSFSYRRVLIFSPLILLFLTTALPAQDMGARTQDAREVEAESLYLRGIDHFLADGYDSAIYCFTEAVAIREELFADAPTLELGKANHLLGASLRMKGAFFAAEPPLQRAIEVFKSLDTVPGFRVARSRNELIAAWTTRGDFGPAGQMAEVVYQQASAEGDIENIISGLISLSNLYLRKEAFEKSKHASRKLRHYILDLLPQADEEDREYYELELNLAYADQNLATALTATDSFPLAESYYLKAIPVLLAWGKADNLQRAHNNLANNYLLVGQLRKAKASLEQAQYLQQYTEDRRNRSVTEDHLGEFHLKSGEPAKALAAFQRAQAALIDGYVPTAPGDVPTDDALRSSPFQTDLFIYLGDQAKAMDALIDEGEDYRFPQMAVYRASDRLIDFIRENHAGGATKLFWRSKVMPVYEAAIRRCYEAERGADAYHFFEKSKAILLYEALAGNDALSRLPDSLRKRDNLLSQRVSQLEGDTLAYLSAREERDKFRQQLAQDYPAYRRAGQAPDIAAPADFYRDYLKPKEKTLVHYFFGPEQAYALTLNGEGVNTFDLGRSDSLSAVAERMLGYFANSAEIQNDPAGYARAAQEAFLAFIQPLHLPPGPLLVIPDGPLTYLPFPAMVTEAVAEVRLGQLPYLLHRHPVSFAHSASLLGRSQVSEIERASLTAFAPFSDGSAKPDYPALPFEQDELNSLSKRFATELFLDGEASLSNFIVRASTARILHLSTHAFSTADAAAPHLAFHDSLLFLRDLYHQDINAEMVVLSACQTNVGRLASGEGVLGLGRGFLQAGAGSIIASLWNVNAFGSGRILRSFYDQLHQGKGRGMALHQAQLDYLADDSINQRNKSPYLWAGFNYYGPDASLMLQQKEGRGYWIGLLMGGLALLVLVGWWRKGFA